MHTASKALPCPRLLACLQVTRLDNEDHRSGGVTLGTSDLPCSRCKFSCSRRGLCSCNSLMGCRGLQFGVPLYGGTLMGQLAYQEGNSKGCDTFQRFIEQPGDLPRIYLVDRGGPLLLGWVCCCPLCMCM